MSNKKNISGIYFQRQVFQESKLDELKKKAFVVSIARLLLFTIGAALSYIAFTTNPDYIIWLIIGIVIAFLSLIKYHNYLFRKKVYHQKMVLVNQNEMDALDGDNSAFKDGENFIVNDKQELHFTIDFDVFGKDSLFQFLNRTVTIGGEKMLAHSLKYPEKSKEEILRKQSAIRELSENIDFRQSFAATGLTVAEAEDEYKQIVDWLGHPDIFLQKKIFTYLTFIVPIINISCILLAAFEILPWSAPSLTLLLSLLFVAVWQKKINKLHLMVSKKVAILQKYEQLLQKIERESFSSPILKELKEKLHVKGQTSVRVINRLSNILSALDNRLNIIAGVLLNGIFIWDIRQIIRLEHWKKLYGKELVNWFSVISKFDSMMSYANFSFNQSNYVYPEISEVYFEFLASELKHPLMDFDKCVSNDIQIKSAGNFMVVTGANMAGKSTLLRTIGVNMLLGMNGAPISAKSLKFYPVDLVSSLRVNDSLKKNTSYFYAEIQRLEYIINQLKGGKEIFVLLDEILRGTNSKDKEQGSKALLRQLLHLNAAGIIATHDLNLAHLSEEFGDKIHTQCFEVEVVGDELVFDYKLRPGTSKNLSATFLMKKMGITL